MKTATRHTLILHSSLGIHEEFRSKPTTELLFDPKEFDLVATKMRTDFTEYVDLLSSRFGENIDWWVSLLANRNTLQSDAFLNLCYLRYAVEKSAGMRVDEIVCSSKALAQTLREQLPSSTNITVRSKFEGSLNALPYLLHVRNITKYVLTSAKQIFFCKASALLVGKSKIHGPLRLADVFILESSFKSGRYDDRYYGNFIASSQNKFQWTYLGTFFEIKHWFKTFKAMRTHPIPFLIKEDYLKLADYLWTLFYPLRARRIHLPQMPLGDLHITRILTEDLRQNATANSVFVALQNFRFTLRLSKVPTMKLEVLLDWFENQNLDKAMNLGFRRFIPSAKIIGVQGFVISKYDFFIKPSPAERKAGVVPEAIGVMGPSLELSLKEFDKDVNAFGVPAFRYQDVGKQFDLPKQQRVLVALPSMNDQLHEVLGLYKKIENELPTEVIVSLRFHPATSRSQINLLLKQYCYTRVRVEDKTMTDALLTATVLVSSNSGVAVEGVAQGVPAIIVGSQTQLTQNPIPGEIDPLLWSLAFTGDELLQQILEKISLRAKQNTQLQDAAKSVVTDYFSANTLERLRKLESILAEKN